jgi:hypothetical protein
MSEQVIEVRALAAKARCRLTWGTVPAQVPATIETAAMSTEPHCGTHGGLMVTRLRLMTAFTIAAALTVPAMAQNAGTSNMEILRQKIKADKKLVVAQNLNLTDAEATAFWPVYEAYQKDLQQINRRLASAIDAYADAYNKGPVSNDTAKKLLDEALAIDDAEVQLKKAATPKIMAALPAMKAARYIQIENKIRAAIRYDLAANIPLVE